METPPTVPEGHGRRRWSFVSLVVGVILLLLAGIVGISDNPPGIVSMLLGGFLMILAIFLRYAKSRGRTFGQELLYWAPRVLCIVTVMFLSIFALDAFSDQRSVWENILAFLMHLLPVLLMVVVLAVSWRWEWVGGLFFIGIAILYVVRSWGERFFWTAAPLISGPLLLVGALFLLNWRYRDTLRGSPK